MAVEGVQLNVDGDINLDIDGNRYLCDDGGDCCKPNGGECFQEWETTFDCIAGTWSAVTSVQKKCLGVTTSTAWHQVSSTATTCTYRRWVDMLSACTANATCTALSNTATPDPPVLHPDCCQTCCDFADGNWACCFSDMATWSGSMPSVTYTGDDPDQAADIAWYNDNIAGTTITLSGTTGCGDWQYHTGGGTTNGFDMLSPSGDWDIVGAGGIAGYAFQGISATQTCCTVTVTSYRCVTHAGVIPDTAGGSTFTVANNFCCYNSPELLTCVKAPGACDGFCDVMP